MSYSWLEKSFSKYGVQVTNQLIKKQQIYENQRKDNDCKSCGKANEGTLIELDDGLPILMHFGLWLSNKCTYCGKAEQKAKEPELVQNK